ncbi:hypothetical protein LTSEUGA_2238 [Salmonella enterica subsp. enterica serovar Uganda str. R8-3404]|uniref:Uncharacterized protein n=1 Tax=Salmonella enterica subsp. enterica serovar Uganda str. R8-3404 TaxID=913083 RepID=A0A6C8H3S4_SALET|nr:hypothetical protein LTSEUGA_2238 [Salmonella enterica subsp. enterica serovar Uganda str. R8-3404]
MCPWREENGDFLPKRRKKLRDFLPKRRKKCKCALCLSTRQFLLPII